MTTEQDKLQDMKIQELEKNVEQIKNITHGSKELGWNGIIIEHRALSDDVKSMVTSFTSVWKALRWLVATLITIGGAIVSLISVGVIKI